MNVKIREAKREDYSGIATISKEDLGYECAAELVKRQLKKVIADEGSKVFVAEQGGEIVGYIHVADYNAHDFYRRQGYGNEKEQMRFMKQIRCREDTGKKESP